MPTMLINNHKNLFFWQSNIKILITIHYSKQELIDYPSLDSTCDKKSKRTQNTLKFHWEMQSLLFDVEGFATISDSIYGQP
jgi:hypothetical protein